MDKRLAQPWQEYALLVSILSFALLFRAWNLPEKGLFGYDESYGLDFCRGAASVLRNALDQRDRIWRGELTVSQLAAQERERAVVIPNYLGVKPGHAAIMCGSVLALGPVDYAGALAMVFFSVGTVYLGYLIGCEFYGSSVGLLCALILSLDPFLTAHARTGKEIADAQFFFMLSILFLLSAVQTSSLRRAFIAGLATGILITVNYTVFLAPVLLLLLTLVFSRVTLSGLGNYVRFHSVLWVGIFIPIAIAVISTMLLGKFVPDLPVFLSGKGVPRSSFSLSTFQPFFFWQAYRISEGDFGFLLLLWAACIAAVRCLRQHRRIDLVLITLSVGYLSLLGLLTVAMFTIPRTSLIAYPSAALLVAAGIIQVYRWLLNRPIEFVGKFASIGFVGVILVFLAASATRSVQLIRLQSGYKEAAEWLWLRTDGRVDSLIAFPMIDFYLKDRSRQFFPDDYSGNSLCSAFHAGQVRYLLVDWNDLTYVASLPLPEPVFTVSNPVGSEPIYTVEGSPGNLQYALELASNPVAAQIRIFDLSHLCSSNATGIVQ